MEVEDLATCVLRFKDGPLGVINVGWFSKDFIQTIQVCGTAKNLCTHIAPPNKLSIIWRDIKTRLGINRYDSYFEELRHFVECLEKDTPPSPSGEEGLIDLQILSMAYNNASKIT